MYENKKKNIGHKWRISMRKKSKFLKRTFCYTMKLYWLQILTAIEWFEKLVANGAIILTGFLSQLDSIFPLF